MIGARRQREPCERALQQRVAVGIRHAPALDLLDVQPCVRLRLAMTLTLPRRGDALAHRGARLPGDGGADAVPAMHRLRATAPRSARSMRSSSGPEMRAAIARDLVRRAAAPAAGVAEIAARAGIHRRDELEPRRKRRLARRARDVDAARFERLAQHFEHPAIPLRQLVEEQHAVMRERDLAGPRIAAAADQRDRGGRVVRRAKRAPPPVVGTKSGRSAIAARRIRAPRPRTAAAAVPADAAPASICRCPAGRSSTGCAIPRRRLPARAWPAPVRARRSDPEPAIGSPAAAASRPAAACGRSDARRPRAAIAAGWTIASRTSACFGGRRRGQAQRRGRRAAPKAPSPARRESRAARRSARARRRIRIVRAPAPESARSQPGCRARSADRSGPDSFGRSAGARLTVIRRAGNSNCAFCSAARTRSRASRTSVSGNPTR